MNELIETIVIFKWHIILAAVILTGAFLYEEWRRRAER